MARVPFDDAPVTADTALRLGRYFDASPEFWMNLQQLYELRRAAEQIGAGIDAIPRGQARSADHSHPEP